MKRPFWLIFLVITVGLATCARAERETPVAPTIAQATASSTPTTAPSEPPTPLPAPTRPLTPTAAATEAAFVSIIPTPTATPTLIPSPTPWPTLTPLPAGPPATPVLAGLPELLRGFNAMRAHEGAALAAVLEGQLASIEALVVDAGAAVEARREAQAEALRVALARVLDNTEGADPDRVAQELALIAVKSDVREEIDRLGAHVAQARSLIAETGPCGRKLDFLMQEFNREANTLCAKSQFQELTRVGLEIKAVVDQMREQVQNVE